jgi:hypothetical protein
LIPATEHAFLFLLACTEGHGSYDNYDHTGCSSSHDDDDHTRCSRHFGVLVDGAHKMAMTIPATAPPEMPDDDDDDDDESEEALLLAPGPDHTGCSSSHDDDDHTRCSRHFGVLVDGAHNHDRRALW